MFGWAGIAGTLLVAPPSQGGAGLTMDQTTNIFAMVASTSMFSPLLMGIVLDKYGPRVESVISNIIIGIGIQTIALAESYATFAVGACTVAFGGPGIQAAVVSFSNLFPDTRYFVMSTVNGSIAISFAILPVFNLFWEVFGIGYRTMFQSYLLVVILSGIGSFLLLPDEPFESIGDEDDLAALLLRQEDGPFDSGAHLQSQKVITPLMDQVLTPAELVMESTKHVNNLTEQPLCSFLRDDPCHQLVRQESFVLSKKAIEKGLPSLVSLKDLPFLQQMTSGSYIRTLIVFVAASFTANFYIDSITTEVSPSCRCICGCWL